MLSSTEPEIFDALTPFQKKDHIQLVKEQKGRITELSKAKQEQAHEYKVRIIPTLGDILVCTTRRRRRTPSS